MTGSGWSSARDDLPLDLPDDIRARLLATCEALIETINARDEQTKLRSLVTDLERLRDRLTSS